MDAWEYLIRLSEIPHRGATTPKEREAARWLGGELEELGYQVTYQPFRAPRDTLHTGPVLVGLLQVLGLILALSDYEWGRGFGALLATVALLPLLGELLGFRPNLDLLLPKDASQNVLARPFAAEAGAEDLENGGEAGDGKDAGNLRSPGKGGEARPLIVLTSHYDTQIGSRLFNPAFLPYLKAFFTTAYVGFFGLPVGLWIATLAPRWWGGWWLALVAALVLLLTLSWVRLARVGAEHVNGANDNGSGTSLVLALARRWAREPRKGVDLLCLFTGAEEVGTRGMIRYMKRYGASLPRPTAFVNIDNVGAGRFHYLPREGMLRPVRYDTELARLALADEGTLGGPVPAGRPPLLPTDGMIPALAGFPAITFIGYGRDGLIPNYHWPTDVLANVDRELLLAEEEFLWRYLGRLAAYLQER